MVPGFFNSKIFCEIFCWESFFIFMIKISRILYFGIFQDFSIPLSSIHDQVMINANFQYFELENFDILELLHQILTSCESKHFLSEKILGLIVNLLIKKSEKTCLS
jgi:hypothetical protein